MKPEAGRKVHVLLSLYSQAWTGCVGAVGVRPSRLAASGTTNPSRGLIGVAWKPCNNASQAAL